MNMGPDVTVAAIVQHEGRFLLVEEMISGRPVFNQPAGHVEAGETLLEAVVRETREEAAWLFHPEAFLGVYFWTRPGQTRQTMCFSFIGQVSDHRPTQPLDRGILRTIWLDRAQLVASTGRHRSPLVLRRVDDYLSGRRLPLTTVADLDLEQAAKVQLAQG